MVITELITEVKGLKISWLVINQSWVMSPIHNLTMAWTSPAEYTCIIVEGELKSVLLWWILHRGSRIDLSSLLGIHCGILGEACIGCLFSNHSFAQQVSHFPLSNFPLLPFHHNIHTLTATEILISVNLSFISYVYVWCVCAVHICVLVYVHMSAYRGQRLIFILIPSGFFTFMFGSVLYWSLGLPIRPGWLATTKPYGSTCLNLITTESINLCFHAWIL